MKKKLLVIGNGPIFNNYKELFYDSDVIVRFNNANKIGEYDDGRQTILVYCNTGGPGKHFLNESHLINSTDFSKCKILLIPRVEEVHVDHFKKIKSSFAKYEEKELKSYSEAILPFLLNSGKEVISISKQFNYECFQSIKNVSTNPFICPSTGFMTVNFLLDEPRFSSYEMHLIGFGFRGWKGHPWHAEKQIIQALSIQNKLILHSEPRLKLFASIVIQKVKKNKIVLFLAFISLCLLYIN